MLKRKAWDCLCAWNRQEHKKALLIKGARQIGKTTLVREFARQRYGHFVEVDFLTDSKAEDIFSQALDADTVTENLSAYARRALVPGRTLVLLDEIQECPAARTAIKFLVEDGRFDYVETGSLLGVKTNQVASYPVGFEEHLQMSPMDFKEFCEACGLQRSMFDYLQGCFDQRKPLSQAVHETMLRLFSTYLVVGGIPEIVQRHVDTHDIAQVEALQQDLLDLYRLEGAKFDVLQGDLSVNMGSIAENVIAQELRAQGFSLHYYNSKRVGEVDFVVQSGRSVLPIEVKSGNDWMKHKALDNLLAVSEWGIPGAFVLCKGNVAVEGAVTYLPLYMAMFIQPAKLPERATFEVDLSALDDIVAK